MNIENEYYNLKQELKQEQEKLQKLESTEIVEDENNPFSIEDRIESKNRGIKSCKNNIKELKELIDEVTVEIREFIANGGEVSNETLNELEEEETSSDDSFTVDFKVYWNKNPKIYFEGYVNIPEEECEDEEIEWYHYNAQGFATPNSRFIQHDGVDGFKGATDEQEWEIEQFKDDFLADSFWIDECICQSDADENRTYVRENCTLIINEGAKMECKIKELDPFYNKGDYVVEVIPYFNGKKVDIASYMNYTNEEFDPWNNNFHDSSVEHGHIYFEMSKDYWDADFKEELMEDVNEEARRIYARCITSELGVYNTYGEVMEQALDGSYDNDWLFRLSQCLDMSEEDFEMFLIEEGFEFEHQFIKDEDV